MSDRQITASGQTDGALAEENARLRARIEQLEEERRALLQERVSRERTERTTREALLKKTEELALANARLNENQTKLVHSEKMAGLGQLAAGVAHEINNPVGFVMSNLGTLADYLTTFKRLLGEYRIMSEAVREGNAEGAGEMLNQIEAVCEEEDLDYILADVDSLLAESRDGANRVKEIVEGLRSFARLDEAELKETDINESIESTLKVVWNELKYKCQVHTDLGEIPRIRCYPGQLNQVFLNLLVNAAQAIPEKGEIRVETGATESEVVIRVSDTGVGIPPEDLPKLYDPFFTTKPVGKGTGLGLSISHGIIQKHGGSIEVESEVGAGTTFTIRLPKAGVEEEPEDGEA